MLFLDFELRTNVGVLALGLRCKRLLIDWGDFNQVNIYGLFAGPVFAHVLGDAEAEPQVELFFQLHRSLRQVRAVASKGQQLRSHAVLVQVIEVKEDVFIGSVQDQKSKLLWL